MKEVGRAVQALTGDRLALENPLPLSMGSVNVAFKFEGREVRSIVDEKGQPWLVVKGVCDILGLDNSSHAVSRLEDKDKGGYFK